MRYHLLTCILFLLSHSAFAQDTASNQNKIYEHTEIEPAFPGGDVSWRRFLMKNLNVAVAVNNAAPAGQYTVWVKFLVDKEGNVSDIQPLTNFGYGLENEVVRVIKLAYRWV